MTFRYKLIYFFCWLSLILCYAENINKILKSLSDILQGILYSILIGVSFLAGVAISLSIAGFIFYCVAKTGYDLIIAGETVDHFVGLVGLIFGIPLVLYMFLHAIYIFLFVDGPTAEDHLWYFGKLIGENYLSFSTATWLTPVCAFFEVLCSLFIRIFCVNSSFLVPCKIGHLGKRSGVVELHDLRIP